MLPSHSMLGVAEGFQCSPSFSKRPRAAPLQVLKGNEAFVVEPLSGVVPANGQAYVNVTFTPVAFRTEELMLQVGVWGLCCHVCCCPGA
jgi:hypothetical protein